MQGDLEVILEELLPQYWHDLAQLVAIPSVAGEASYDAPYGPGPKAALEWMLDRAQMMGFEVVNLDNRIGYAQWMPVSQHPLEGYYGIFGHLDVVSAGQGWNQDPWTLTRVGDAYQGRGVLDNKGPILANLYAVYALKCLGYSFDRPIRVVFGTNEETGFDCIQHYLSCEPAPVFGWTPDCKWPVVYGERGRLGLEVSVDSKDVETLYRFINHYLLSGKGDGQELGVAYEDEGFGRMMMRGYRLGLTDRRHWVTWALAYPAICTKEEILTQIKQHLPAEANLRVCYHWPPVLIDKNSDMVQILQAAYQQVTAQNLAPVTTTGGTYAKFVPNIVAYGPSYPHQRDIAHLPNEWLAISDLEQNLRIYAQALVGLWRYDHRQGGSGNVST